MEEASVDLHNGLQGTNFFLYKGKKYPFNIVFFNCFSQYFTTNEIQIPLNATIKLVNDSEDDTNFSEASINDFINYCQNQRINLNKENVVTLHRLSKMYNVPTLIESTENFLKNHKKEFIIEFLKMNQTGDGNSGYMYEYEELISSSISEFIDNNELLSLPLCVIYRILSKYEQKSEVKKHDDEERRKVTEFCFRCLDKFGRNASVLFGVIDFGTARADVVNRLLNEYGGKFDFHFINEWQLKTLYEVQSKIIKQEEKRKMNEASLREELDEMKKKQDVSMRSFEQKIEKLNSSKISELERKIQAEFTGQLNFLKEQNEKLNAQMSEMKKSSDTEFGKMKKQIQDELTSQLDFLKKQIEELNGKVTQKSAIIDQLKSQNEKLNNKNALAKCQFLGESNPKGIISFLNGSVTLSAGGGINPSYPVSNLKNFDDRYFFNYYNYNPQSESDSYIKFDFGSTTIDLSSYFIRSNYCSASHWHPKTWRIEGSNDDSSWVPLDRKVNDQNLNGPYKQHHFVCQVNGNGNGRYRYIRYVQEDSWSNGHPKNVHLTYFELYGEVFNDK